MNCFQIYQYFCFTALSSAGNLLVGSTVDS